MQNQQGWNGVVQAQEGWDGVVQAGVGYVRPKCKLPECNNPRVSSNVAYCAEHQRNLESWRKP